MNNEEIKSKEGEEKLEEKIKQLEEKLAQTEKEKQEYLEGWQRERADFINYKKEEQKRFEEFTKFSLEVFIKELIEVLDSLDVGLAVLDEKEPAAKGLLLIRSKLLDKMRKFGLEEIKVEPGQNFDPFYHEAVEEVEANFPAGAIVEEITKGYLLNGRVIRPTKVKVAKSS